MSFAHNQMAHASGRSLLQQLRAGNAPWVNVARMTPLTTVWQGVADWPRPDQAFQDQATQATLAIEFKPPGHSKTEYVRGLGQAITYLDTFEMAALVLPSRAVDGFRIAEYFTDLVTQQIDGKLPLGLFVYDADPAVMLPCLPVPSRLVPLASAPLSTRTVFWAYWRDLSQYDLFELLRRMDARGTSFEVTFGWFWRHMRGRGLARTWEGRPRATSQTVAFERSELLNSRLSLRHCGLVASDGSLTEAALQLIQFGKVFGPESVAFRQRLAHAVLLEGRHLELIFWIDEVQSKLSPAELDTSQNYYEAIDDALIAEGILAAPPAGVAKPTFFRDEPKLWNKLGLLKRGPNGRYFVPGRGITIDWRAVVSIVGEF